MADLRRQPQVAVGGADVALPSNVVTPALADLADVRVVLPANAFY
jgi:hypothetical protein